MNGFSSSDLPMSMSVSLTVSWLVASLPLPVTAPVTVAAPFVCQSRKVTAIPSESTVSLLGSRSSPPAILTSASTVPPPRSFNHSACLK